MKVLLSGKNLDDLIPLLEPYKVDIVNNNPDLIICHGGDGALLGAEREYPGIPKFPIRDAATAPVCEDHNCETRLKSLFSNTAPQTELIKLSGSVGEQKLIATNDIFIHNHERVSALRYRVWINDELYAREIVGDGVGMATPHGSTAYYRSITHSIFRVGLGLAFSNSTEVVNHLVIPDDSVVRIRILRGPAIMVGDNAPERIHLTEGDEAVIRKISDKAVVLGLEEFMCRRCRQLRHKDKYKAN
jgi:NAD+ kinase